MVFVYIYNKQQLNPTTMRARELKQEKKSIEKTINSLENLYENGFISQIEKIHASVILENAIERIDTRLK